MHNQWDFITSFGSAVICPDAKRLARIKLKRRYYSGGDLFDADWTTITSYLLNDGIGDISAGIDDDEWIVGVIKNANVDLVFDNTLGKFNNRSDVNSFWYNSATAYYIPNSLIDIEFGFELPTGTQFFSPNPFLSGLIDGDSFTYNFDNTVKFTVLSKLELLKNLKAGDILSYVRRPIYSSTGLIHNLKDYIISNWQTTYSLTVISNNMRADICYDKADANNIFFYDFFENTAKITGSLFGVNRQNEIFFTYFGNSNYYVTTTGFTNDTSTVISLNYFTSTGSTCWDISGHGYNMTLTGTTPSITVGLFGNGRLFSDYNGHIKTIIPPLSGGAFTIETLFKLHKISVGGNVSRFIEAFSLDGVDFIGSYYTNDGKLKSEGLGNYLLGENQWYYLTNINDPINNINTTYINGFPVYTKTPYKTSTSLFIYAGMLSGYIGDIEFDSFRFTQGVRSEATIKATNASIFGHKNNYNTNTYSFYNYGSNNNILNILNYSNGFEHIYNDIIINNNKNNEDYFLEGYMTIPSGQPNTFRIYKGNTHLSITIININGITGFNNLDENITVSQNGSYFSILWHDLNTDNAFTSHLYIEALTTTALATITSIDSKYLGFRSTFFRELVPTKLPRQNYEYINTLSVQEYGKKEYIIDSNNLFMDILSNTSAIATSLLEDKAQPKIRMGIETRFLEGDLDLLNKVTVNWQSPKHDININNMYTSNAGGINWTSKDFYIIGYTHSWTDNKTIYKLREV